jgi:hypothetical protein
MYTVHKDKDGARNNLTNMEQHFNFILEHYNFVLYNGDNYFKMQLFDKNIYANDIGVDCIAEFDSLSLVGVVNESIQWIIDEKERD